MLQIAQYLAMILIGQFALTVQLQIGLRTEDD